VIQSWCAPVSLRWYEAGEHCDDPVAGDVILVDHTTLLAKAISTGETIESHLWRHDLKGFTWLDHCGIIRNDAGEFMVSEMGPRGHELRPLATYVDRLYCVAHFEVSEVLRPLVLASDEDLHNIDYGWIQYFALVANGLSGTKISLALGDAMICSTAVARCGANIYFIFDRPDEDLIPSDIAKMVGAKR
jgi:hypothetical protein